MEEKTLKWDGVVVYRLIQGARRVNKKRLGSFIQASAGASNTHTRTWQRRQTTSRQNAGSSRTEGQGAD